MLDPWHERQNRLLRRDRRADGPQQALEALLGLPVPLRRRVQARAVLGGVELPPLLPGQVPWPTPGGRRRGQGDTKCMTWRSTRSGLRRRCTGHFCLWRSRACTHTHRAAVRLRRRTEVASRHSRDSGEEVRSPIEHNQSITQRIGTGSFSARQHYGFED